MIRHWQVGMLMIMGFVVMPSVALTADEIFAPNQLEAVYEGPDFSGKDDPKVARPPSGECEIRLAGTRGGAFSGQVVAFCKAPARGPEAKIGELKQKDGKGVIPASAVEVRYSLPTSGNGLAKMPAGVTGIFDALDVKPRETGNVHPVWITVNVPADAKPGDYEGKLSVAGREVPVKLSVADWALPKPQDFTAWVDFVESPESVALRYEKKLWSDEHWALVGKSFDQLGRVGNKTLYIPLMAQTHFGNSESMVRWIKGEKEREFKHDFSIAEKYVDTCIERAGKPKIVVLYIFECFLGGSHGGKREEWARGVPFTLLDPKTGEVTTGWGPGHNNSNSAYPNYPQDTIDFWKPVIEGMRERINKRGIADESILLGISGDMRPGKPTMDYLVKTFPWVKWCSQGHQPIGGLHGMSCGYVTSQYGGLPGVPKFPWAGFFRDDWKLDFQRQMVAARTDFDVALSCRQRGVGRMSGDFWACIKDQKGKWSGRLVNRYPLSSWAQLSLYNLAFTYPGEDGALGTVRLEMLREGAQESEARSFIEKALADKALHGRLGDDLAQKAREILSVRPGYTVKKVQASAISDEKFAEGPWQDRSAKLYAVAAEVALRLGSHLREDPSASTKAPADKTAGQAGTPAVKQ